MEGNEKMSKQKKPLTYEGMLKGLRKTDRMLTKTYRSLQKTERIVRGLSQKQEETDRLMKQVHKDIGRLGGRIGDIVLSMVRAHIDEKFEKLGYHIETSWQKRSFKNKKMGFGGEVDLFLFGGEVDILIEVKTKLEKADVSEHITRLGKYRRYLETGGIGNDRFIGAVTGAIVDDEAVKFAQENGMYVIVQSGDAFEILTPPEGFTAKEW